MKRPKKCMYPDKLGGCEETDLVPVNWGPDKVVIGWLCKPHAMTLVLKGATDG